MSGFIRKVMVLVLLKIYLFFVLLFSCERYAQPIINTPEIEVENFDLQLSELKQRLATVLRITKPEALDLTGDGLTNARDVAKLEQYPNLPAQEVQTVYLKIMRYILGQYSEDKAKTKWDVNQDKRFDVGDLILIRRTLSRKMNETMMIRESTSANLASVEAKLYLLIQGVLSGGLPNYISYVDFNNDGLMNDSDIAIWQSYLLGDMSHEELTKVGVELLELFKSVCTNAESGQRYVAYFDFNDSGRVDISDIRPLRSFVRMIRVRHKRRKKVKQIETALKRFLSKTRVYLPEVDFNQDGKSNVDDIPYLDGFSRYQDPNYSMVYKQIMSLGLDAVEHTRTEPIVLDIFDIDRDSFVESEEVDRLLLLIARETR